MKPKGPARLFFLSAALICLTTTTVPAARADFYTWGADGGGDFETANWFNNDDPDDMKADQGPPGGGDTAYIPDNTVLTASGGSVGTLECSIEGGGLSVGGSFSVDLLGSITLTGGGNLTANTIGVTGNDSAESINVQGASLTANNVTNGNLTASAGGSIVVKSSITNVSGAASGAMSLLEVDGNTANGGVGALAGATAHVGSVSYDGTTSPPYTEADGAGSTLVVDGDGNFGAKFLSVTNGGQATFGGNLNLFANTAGVEAGGSLTEDGQGSMVTVAGTVDLAPGPGGSATTSYIGSIMLSNGALLHATTVIADGGKNTSGNISMFNGANIQAVGLSIGNLSVGDLDIESGSGVTMTGGGAVAFGLVSGSSANVTISGHGSFLNAAGTLVALGREAGSSGTVKLDTDGLMQISGGSATSYLHVGDAGSGTVNINGGAVNVLGAATTFEIGSQAGSSGSVGVEVANGLTLAGPAVIGNQGTGNLDVQGTGTSATASGNFYVGGDSTQTASNGHGTVYVGDGAQMTVGTVLSNYIGVGNGSGAVGEIEATGAGTSLTLNGVTIAGVNGDGELAASNGATVVSHGMQLGASAGASGGMLVYNSGTVWTETQALEVGSGSGGASGGIAVNDGGLLRVYHNLFIQNDGVVTVTVLLPNSTIFPNPPTPTTSTPNGRIFVGTDNFGPDGAIRVGTGGVLKGKGKQTGTSVVHTNVIGKVVVGLGGKFQPGADPDIFSVQGDVDLSDAGAGGGETDFEIGGATTAGTDYDQLQATGTVTLGGTLNLTLLPGYVPKVGDTFNFIQAGAVTGSFTQVVAPGLTVNPVAGSGGLTVTVTSVTATAAPVITSATAATAFVGTAFSYQIAATNSPAGYTASNLPAGLSVDASTGLISGTATTVGTDTVTLSATNTGGTGMATLTLTVSAASAPGTPTITSAATATGTVGTAFSYQIAASNTPTTFSAAGLPAGLTINAASGSISGTPTMAGTYEIILGAANAAGTGSTVTLALTVSPALPTVTLTALVPAVTVGSGQIGEFLLTLSSAAVNDLQVAYTVKGTGDRRHGLRLAQGHGESESRKDDQGHQDYSRRRPGRREQENRRAHPRSR